jgi:F-type H+-transporting ATPase subunit a
MYSPLEQFNILNNGFLSNHMYILILVLFVVSLFLVNTLASLKNSFFQKNFFITTNSSINFFNYSFAGIFQLISDIITSKKYFYALLPILFTGHAIILFFNLFGLVPFAMTISSQFISTFTVSFLLFVFINIFGIVKHKLSFALLFLPGNMPMTLLLLLVPIEMLSFFFRPISLAIRLFANMMAGHILLKVVYGFVLHFAHGLNIFTTLGFIANGFLIILTLLETAAAFIQALIFTILIAVYIQEMINVG